MPVVGVEVSSSAPEVVDGGFEVSVRFGRAANGFSVGDVVVVNGSAGGLSGSGAAYRVVVTPAAGGSVVVWVPAGVARDAAGEENLASPALVRTAILGGGASPVSAGPWLDTWDRAAMLSAYRAEFERVEPDPGYTGDVDGCVAGTTSRAFRDSELQRINWYRRMAGVDVVAESADSTVTAQHAALMMAAAGDLSHEPSLSWPCYSELGADGASSSNLVFGNSGVAAADAYVRDGGSGNEAVGHRGWVLSPYVRAVGMGAAFGSSSANAVARSRRSDGQSGPAPRGARVRGVAASGVCSRRSRLSSLVVQGVRRFRFLGRVGRCGRRRWSCPDGHRPSRRRFVAPPAAGAGVGTGGCPHTQLHAGAGRW